MLNDEEITRYQAYVLYGLDKRDLLERIVMYLRGCQNLIIDKELEPLINAICRDRNAKIIELKSYSDIDRVLAEETEGKGIVFEIRSPTAEVYAIALIPVNQYNKRVVRSR